MAYRLLRPVYARLIRGAGSLAVANGAALVTGVLQACLVAAAIVAVSIWHFGTLHTMRFTSGPMAPFAITLSVVPGASVLSLLFALLVWPVAVVFAAGTLWLERARTGCWTHAPPLYAVVSRVQMAVVAPLADWMHAMERREAVQALVRAQDGKLPREMVDLVMRFVDAHAASEALEAFADVTGEHVDALPRLGGRKWVSHVALFGWIREQRSNADILSAIFLGEADPLPRADHEDDAPGLAGGDAGATVESWLFVFSRDVLVFALFVTIYASLMTLVHALHTARWIAPRH
ncbi:hypothetical protein HK105_203274 [Polyrhizophydium stewartii]|uniref:Transmembrane protein n=1 Tax=Polyrhizophydium stewartii TaxID=2732419 RepID=A0ABR4NCP8_9FUNG|nr:hypothetical protein HK105_000071 [Polyrhizophydium stewartii]